MDGKGTCAASNPGVEQWGAALAHWVHPDDADAVRQAAAAAALVNGGAGP